MLPKSIHIPLFESFIDYIDNVSKGTYKILNKRPRRDLD